MTAIELINIKKYFKDGPDQIEALKETNLTINKGEFVAVIGPSGSGKSTFLTIIAVSYTHLLQSRCYAKLRPKS